MKFQKQPRKSETIILYHFYLKNGSEYPNAEIISQDKTFIVIRLLHHKKTDTITLFCSSILHYYESYRYKYYYRS